MPSLASLFLRLALIAGVLLGEAACRRATPANLAPLPQRGYLWQRDWNPAVTAALGEARPRLSGVILLGAEILWKGATPEVVRADISWAAVRASGVPCAVGLRVAPFPGPFAKDDAAARVIVSTARSLRAEAAAQGVKLTELQLDFDCAQRKLAGYRLWVEAVRQAVKPLPVVLTTLPSWLDEPDFPALIRAADGYVLQVHSVPTTAETGKASLCDPTLARQWVARASRLGIPFSVALPTYRCLAGYGPDSKLRGVVMDSVRPPWPPDTRVLEFGTDAAGIASLVLEWQQQRPASLRELIWYRLPVATDQFNWRWPTLDAVRAGRPPEARYEVVAQGENPIDLALENRGESDEPLLGAVTATWPAGTLQASDSLAGWTIQTAPGQAVFQTDHAQRLSPGEKRSIGWLRYDKAPSLSLRFTPGR